MRAFVAAVYLIARIIKFVVSLISIAVKDDHVHVRGYYRKDGTYVRPHYRTAPEILSLTIGPSIAATIGNIAHFLLKVMLK